MINDNLINTKLINKIYNKYFNNYKFSINIDKLFNIINLSVNLYLDYIKYNLFKMHEPYFHENIKKEIIELIKLQLNEITVELLEFDLNIIIQISEILVYKYIVPPRSYKNNSIVYKKSIKQLQELSVKLEYLKNVYQPEQRTTEWYEFRHNILTASNIWKAFVNEKTFEQLVIEKCKPINIDKYNYVNEQSPMHWGQKYEPVSTSYYEYIYKTRVDEFGCILHKDYSFLAASPDGINSLEDSPLFGRMLEIKNIFNREISGIPKLEYWIQMQIQMEVCDLNECDFLETRFLEYNNETEFLNDYFVDIDLSGNFKNNIMLTKDSKFKGMIIAYFKDNKPYYLYSPFACTYDELLKWREEIEAEYIHLEWFKNIYYRLDEISCILVLRNKLWFLNSLDTINSVWNAIKEKKNNKSFLDDVVKRKPYKEIKQKSKCLIDIETIELDNELVDNNIKSIDNSIKTLNIKLNL